ncbi:MULTISPECIES: hypothetical protein [Rhodococcus]|uniref:hypothetical protein n=1 Tax=Rhodococcus TaxID=1827 RepID=UPI002954C6D5|nr:MULTISPECIES: hypothetical protein [Rhodococcus]MDV7244475.1 hypothetical protein [Rhodococcus oxybenzonivorans]MDV7274282.1 hypothetical protein [Rhodococcus oxybenzonivorans]MDV7337832.1 hypothetical protein [Rhodococcus oxybenzonivorans]MDV7345232.1 hypothetical protein [Rhodococcus oxybenzonivorans]MDV8028920.1 hypothetical protein [Rhodococcus sp. IEGM 27]
MNDSIIMVGWNGTPPYTLGGPTRGRARDVWIEDGLAGLWVPAPRTPTRTSRAYQHGSTPKVTKIEERLLDFQVRIEGRTRSDFEMAFADWMAVWSFDYDNEVITKTGSGPRSIRLRLDRDPKIVGRMSMQTTRISIEMVVVACWPYLTSKTDVIKWEPGVGSHTGTVVVDNPTDVPLWMKFEGTPATKWILPDGISDRTVPLKPQTTGWRVQTRQDFQTIRAAGAGFEVWKAMRGVNFMHEIPPRTPPTEIPVEVQGSAVPAELRIHLPRYHEMPWG